MKIKDLNKRQLVLLNILVSFVTAAAVFAVMRAFSEENPFRKSFVAEKNVTDKQSSEQKKEEDTLQESTTTEKQNTREVKRKAIAQEQSIISAAQENLGSIVQIYEKGGEGEAAKHRGLGFLISKDGKLLTSTKTLSDSLSVLYQGKTYFANVLRKNENAGIALLEINNTDNVDFQPVQISDSKIQEQDPVVVLAGEDGYNILSGKITSLKNPDNLVQTIATDINFEPENSGNPLMNTNGTVVGIYVISPNGSYTVNISNDRLVSILAE